MRLSVVFLSYNTCDLTEQALRTVLDAAEGMAVEVFVADNASVDGSAEMVAEKFPQVKLIRSLRECDLAMGSRFGETSKVEKWAWHRKLTSQVGVAAAKLLTGAEDPLSGYFFLHREVLEGFELTSSGYKILLEVLIKCRYDKHRSVPFIFRNRQFSSSKLNLQEYLLFAKQIVYFSWYKLFRCSTRR